MKRIIIILFIIFYSQSQTAFDLKDKFLIINNTILLDQIDLSHSNVSFIATHMGRNKVTGRFLKYTGSISYNPDNVLQTSVNFFIDVKSLTTGHKWRDEDLISENWLNSENYPLISFKSSRTRKLDKQFLVEGVLTIKNHEKKITLLLENPIGLYPAYNGYQASFYAKTKIHRKDFDVVGNDLWNQIVSNILTLGDTIEIDLSIVCSLTSEEFKLSRSSKKVKEVYQFAQSNDLNSVIKFIENNKYSKDFSLIDRIALLYQLSGNLENSLALFRYNLNQNPKSLEAKYSLLKSLLINNKKTNVQNLLNEILVENPKHAGTLEIKGLLSNN